jgi:tartrate dehydrogenase/decarboxylase/D-malate dehydrogenase
MKALEETTARGIGTIVGQDKTDTITAAVVAALS